MTSVWGRGRPRRKHSSAAPSVAPPDSSPTLKLGDKLSEQSAGPLGTKPPVANAFAATSIPKYSKDDLQQIFKTVLEAWASAPTPAPALVLASAPAPAPIVAEVPWEKLKAYSPDVYRRKSYIDCYNFCQQYKNYFAIARDLRPTQIPFVALFLWERISVCR